jgi:hypothetical protein
MTISSKDQLIINSLKKIQSQKSKYMKFGVVTFLGLICDQKMIYIIHTT